MKSRQPGGMGLAAGARARIGMFQDMRSLLFDWTPDELIRFRYERGDEEALRFWPNSVREYWEKVQK